MALILGVLTVLVDHYEAYVNATGASEDKDTGMLSLPKAQFANLKPLTFHIGGKDWTLNANAQIWPRSLNTALGGDDEHVYLVVGNVRSSFFSTGRDADKGVARKQERRGLRLYQRLHVHAAFLHRF